MPPFRPGRVTDDLDQPPDRRQPPLAELTARFLGRQSAAVAAGLAADTPGDVEPHEAVPVQAVDPRQAWDEATTAVAVRRRRRRQAPPTGRSWWRPSRRMTGLALAAGNYPQMVRDLTPLYPHGRDAGRPADAGRPRRRTCRPVGRQPVGDVPARRLLAARRAAAGPPVRRGGEALLAAVAGDGPGVAAAGERRGGAALAPRPRTTEAARRWQEHAGERAGAVQPRHGGPVPGPAGRRAADLTAGGRAAAGSRAAGTTSAGCTSRWPAAERRVSDKNHRPRENPAGRFCLHVAVTNCVQNSIGHRLGRCIAVFCYPRTKPRSSVSSQEDASLARRGMQWTNRPTTLQSTW